MKNFSLRELNDNDTFEPTTLYSGAPFTQASFYGNWQKSLGRSVKRFVVDCDAIAVAYFQYIKYPLLFGKYYIYMPYGPVIYGLLDEELLVYLKSEIAAITKNENAVFARLDFTPTVVGNELEKFFHKAPLYTYHSAYFQPRTEWFLGLGNSEDEILMGMHEKTRYSIRLAEKKGIVVDIITENCGEYFEVFFELMTGTSLRNGFSLHSKEYYAEVFKNLTVTNSYLSVAKYDGVVLAIDLVIIYGDVATYVFGASSNVERNRMPTYLAQWKAICYARSLGCADYNFGGISKESSIYKGWEGLTAYKRKFGGREVERSVFYDVVVSSFWYYLYNVRKQIKKTIA